MPIVRNPFSSKRFATSFSAKVISFKGIQEKRLAISWSVSTGFIFSIIHKRRVKGFITCHKRGGRIIFTPAPFGCYAAAFLLSAGTLNTPFGPLPNSPGKNRLSKAHKWSLLLTGTALHRLRLTHRRPGTLRQAAVNSSFIERL